MTEQYIEIKIEELEKRIKALEQPCVDAISRQAVIDYFFRPYSNEESYSNIDIERVIRALPSVQPSRKGHWIAVYQGDEIINYRCSECELGDTNGSTDLYGWNYCRRCGADMRGDGNAK